MKLLNSVSDPTDHVVLFDNFFSSYDLFVALKNKGFRATGTFRENRLRKCPIPRAKELKKQERGWLKYAYEETNEIFIAKWKDNSIVTLGTNYDSVDPLNSVKRWSKDMKKNVDTQRPHLCRVCPGNRCCRFARPSHQCLSHWNLEQEMVVSVVYPHAQYLHGECMAAVFVSKLGGSHGFGNFHEAYDSALFAGTTR